MSQIGGSFGALGLGGLDSGGTSRGTALSDSFANPFNDIASLAMPETIN